MPRAITAASKTESQAALPKPFLLAELLLDSGAVRVNSTDRNITAFGNSFLGIGRLGHVSDAQESADLKPTGLTLSLSGIPSAYISTVLSEQYQGRTVKLWLAFLAADTYALVADPVLLFQGLIDQMGIQIGDTATISLTAESRLARWEVPNVRRYTNEDQQKRFPGDRGLEFVSQTVEREILWGRGGTAGQGGTGGLPVGLAPQREPS